MRLRKTAAETTAGRAHQALVFRSAVWKRARRASALVHLPHFNYACRLLGLREDWRSACLEAGGSGTGRNTPAQRVAEVVVPLHRPGKCGGHGVAGADREQWRRHAAGSPRSLVVERADRAPASQRKNHRLGAHLPDARGRFQEMGARQAVAVFSSRSASCWLGVTTVGLASMPAAALRRRYRARSSRLACAPGDQSAHRNWLGRREAGCRRA